MTSEGFAPAKVNLTLHVTGVRSDGYHLLDSLVVFADIGDDLAFTPEAEMRISVDGPFSEGVPCDAANLIWQAAEVAGWTGHVHLTKSLPHSAGIGGGSADAAAVLRAFGGHEHAARLGADVPVCLSTKPQRMRGIGDELMPVASLPPLEIILVNPRFEVPTATVFSGLTQKNNQPMPAELPEFPAADDFCQWLRAQRNDLQAPAQDVAPQIEAVLAALDTALVARMSGSGATCFGLYQQGAHAEAERLRALHPDWWIAAGKLLS